MNIQLKQGEELLHPGHRKANSPGPDGLKKLKHLGSSTSDKETEGCAPAKSPPVVAVPQHSRSMQGVKEFVEQILYFMFAEILKVRQV